MNPPRKVTRASLGNHKAVAQEAGRGQSKGAEEGGPRVSGAAGYFVNLHHRALVQGRRAVRLEKLPGLWPAKEFRFYSKHIGGPQTILHGRLTLGFCLRVEKIEELLWSQIETRVLLMVQPPGGCVTLDVLLNVPKPQFLLL